MNDKQQEDIGLDLGLTALDQATAVIEEMERRNGWTGNPDDLRGHAEALSADRGLCDEYFESKQEAFVVGLTLGESQGDG